MKPKYSFHFLVLFATLMTTSLGFKAHAGGAPSFTNLSEERLEDINETFSALTFFRPLEPASNFGKYFGISAGGVVQATQSRRVQGFFPDAVPKWFPTGNIVLVIQAPLGLALEAGFLPELSIRNMEYRQYAGNIRWNFTDLFFHHFPVDIAARFGMKKSAFSFKQTISGITGDIDYSNWIYSGSLSASRRFSFFEPYVGFGWASADSKLAVSTPSIQVFGQTFSGSQSVERTNSSPLVFVGFQMHLFFANLTPQYDFMFNQHNVSLKVALKF